MIFIVAQLRIALTIPGAISLGAFEGGVLAALIAAVQRINSEDRDAVRIDAIAGASAGSITAVLAARTILEGLDPVDVMSRAWVEIPTLDDMRTRGFDAPLSLEEIRSRTVELLSLDGDPEIAQPSPITLNLALGCLRGFQYRIGRLGGPPLPATTYLDWGEVTLKSGMPPVAYELPVDASVVQFAAASGATAVAFAPVGIDRKNDRETYAANQVENFPASGWLWYTDGGTLDNEPLGRALDMTNALDESDDRDFIRLHLLISPAPETPPPSGESDRWSNPERAPSWTDTGARVLTLLKAQNLYEDLKRVEKTNSRLAWTRRLEDTLTELFEDRATDPETALTALGDEIKIQKETLDIDAEAPIEAPRPLDTELRRAIRTSLHQATGLDGKQSVGVDMISPLLLLAELPEGTKIGDILAGDFAGHFGGFLDERYRSNDFAAGYRSALEWMKLQDRSFVRWGVDKRRAQRAREHASNFFDPRWVTRTGGQDVNGLSWREKLKLVSVLARMGLVGAVGIVRRQIR
jgi:predicted acylesterase/phospholipase RssA